MTRRLSRRTLLASAAAASLSSRVRAAPQPTPQPTRAELDALLEPIRAGHGLPAVAASVVLNGSTAAAAVGVRKLGSTVPVTAEDQFHLGSCTKSMTATLVGMLIEDGKLRWDSTPARVFPELAPAMRPEYRAVTVEHFLAHRSGLPGRSTPEGKNNLDMHRLPGTPTEQRLAYLRMMLAEAPDYPAGSKLVYSNAGYSVLGAMAERVTGAPWEELITRRLFKPLGMASAGFGAMGTPGKTDQPWQHPFRDGTWVPIGPGPLSDNPNTIGPGGKVHASMADWARYAAMQLRGEAGQDGLIKAATLEHLHTPAFGGEYAGGWFITERNWGGGRVLTHNGTNTMNFAVIWMAPLRQFAVMAAANAGGDAADKACDEAASAVIRRWLLNR